MPDDNKTPDELEAEARREAQQASEAQADSEAFRRAAERARQTAREEAQRDEHEHAMSDAFHLLVGAARPDRRAAGDGDLRGSMHTMTAAIRGQQAVQHARRANELWRRARLLRRIGAAIAAVGLAMTIGGFAGAGNQPANPQGQGPALEDIRTQAPASGAVGRAPVVGPIIAVLNPPDTSYTVQASDPDGDALTYTWTRTSTCGTFNAPNGPTAVWGHPHPPCTAEEFHPGIITVVVSDAGGSRVSRQYAQGSLSGTGNAPTVAPTTTTRTASPTPSATASPAPATTGGPNVPLVAGGLILLGGGGALAAGGGRLAGGPVVAGDGPQNQKRTCDRERAEEARTRAEMERTKATYDQLQQTKSGADFAEQQRRAAERALTAAEGRAGGWMTNADGSKRYPDNEKGRAATAAQDALDAATADARSRRERFEGMGGEAALRQAKDAYDAAKAAHDAAAAALQACLESIAPPPAPEPPPTSGGTATGGGGTTAGPTGPAVSQGSSSETRERQCTPGDKRNERSTTAEVRFNMLNQAKIINDSNYPGVNDIDVYGFLDWLEFIENAFSKGKAINNFASGNNVEGTLDAVEFPDFFTYFGVMREAVDRGLRRMVQVAEGLSKTGTYHLEYPRKTYTLTCANWEECVGGRWEAKRSLTMRLTGTDQGRAGDREVHNASEVGDALNRLFQPLERENARAESSAKAFQERCGS